MGFTRGIFIFVLTAIVTHGQDVTKCSLAGSINCDVDCSNVVLCLGDGNGGFREEIVEECNPSWNNKTNPSTQVEENTYCYQPLRACSTKDSCGTYSPPPFECTSVDQFPDPYDCTFYYFCILDPDTHLVHGVHSECEKGYAYNSERKTCNYKLNSTVCTEGPVPVCNDIGQSGPLLLNKSIYYICKRKEFELYPVLFACPRGGNFNDDLKECEEGLVWYIGDD